MMRIFHDIGRRAKLALAAVLLTGLPLFGGENAVLINGFRIHADRHEINGSVIRLYADGGVTELPVSQVASFEQEEYVAPAPRSPAPVATAETSGKPLDARQLADAAAQKNHLPEALIRSIMHAESAFQPDAVSPKGAIGLMQLMPGTAQQLHADPRDPRQNVEAGTAYLRSLLERYQDRDDQVARAVAAYNAGPGAVDRYNGVPPYHETRLYVFRVLTEYLKSVDPKTGVPKAAAGD
jgi:soluble lytic murein transglycosylase-like protein